MWNYILIALIVFDTVFILYLNIDKRKSKNNISPIIEDYTPVNLDIKHIEENIARIQFQDKENIVFEKKHKVLAQTEYTNEEDKTIETDSIDYDDLQFAEVLAEALDTDLIAESRVGGTYLRKYEGFDEETGSYQGKGLCRIHWRDDERRILIYGNKNFWACHDELNENEHLFIPNREAFDIIINLIKESKGL